MRRSAADQFADAVVADCRHALIGGVACGIPRGRREWWRLWRALRGSGRWLAACLAAPLAGCQQAGVLDPQGPIASAERLLMINATAIMLVVVVPVILATLGFAWWYRSSNPRAVRSLDESYEGRAEFVIWSIPVLIVILLSGVTWISTHQLDHGHRSPRRRSR